MRTSWNERSSGGFAVLASVAARRAAATPLPTGWWLALLAPVLPLAALGAASTAGLTWLTGTGDSDSGTLLLAGDAIMVSTVAIVLVSAHQRRPARYFDSPRRARITTGIWSAACCSPYHC